MSKTNAAKSVDFWLHRFGMEKEAGQKLETLSKGNQQKIQFITTIAHDPDIIVLDEPFSGLDSVNASLLKEVVAEKIRADKLMKISIRLARLCGLGFWIYIDSPYNKRYYKDIANVI